MIWDEENERKENEAKEKAYAALFDDELDSEETASELLLITLAHAKARQARLGRPDELPEPPQWVVDLMFRDF